MPSLTPIAIDLETKPPEMTPDELYRNALESKANPKRNDDTRAEWASDPANQVEAWQALSKDPMRAQLVAWAVRSEHGEWSASSWDDEADLADALWNVVYGHPVLWVGHNITEYDLPLLWWVTWRHDMNELRRMIPNKPFSDRIHDNMQRAGGPSRRPTFVTAEDMAGMTVVNPIEGKGDLAELDFPALYARGLQGFGADVAALLERRARVDVRVEWDTYKRMTA